MRAIALVVFCVAVAIARASMPLPRIVGGSITTINNYPEITALLYAPNGVHFSQWCGGSILNQRSILTAAHCFDDGRNVASRWRFRVGSSFAHSGGVTHNTAQIIRHPNYNSRNWDSDVAIIRSSSNVQYNNNVRAARIAGTNYNLADNQVVWAAGWGVTETGWSSEQLRHVQVWTINQATCRQRYGTAAVTDNMLCSGWLDVGGRDQCGGDSGGPLYHNGIVVGICSWGSVQCAHSFYPGVNARVTRFTQWIQANA